MIVLKQIILKGNITEPTLARLRIKGPGILTANDIELPPNIELVEPQQYIANIILVMMIFFIKNVMNGKKQLLQKLIKL